MADDDLTSETRAQPGWTQGEPASTTAAPRSRGGPRLKAQVAALLEAAETAADEVLGVAQQEAEEHLTEARTEAARLRAEAEGERAQAKAALAEAREEAARLHRESQAEAEALLKLAAEDSDRERRAAAMEASETRAAAQRLALTRQEQVHGLTERLSAQAQAAEAEIERLRTMLGGATESLSDTVAEGWTPAPAETHETDEGESPSDVHRRESDPTRKGLFSGLRT